MKQIRRIAGKTIERYGMIKDCDKVLIAFSGGKDSYALFHTLTELKRRSPIKFDIVPVFIDSGFADPAPAIRYLKDEGHNLIIRKTDIAQHIKNIILKGTNGDRCFICARLRRGFLLSSAKEHGCNRLALGHNLDDAVETFLLNLFYSGNAKLMRPIYRVQGIDIIRPLIQVPEKMIVKASEGLPIIYQDCPYTKGESKREYIKSLVEQLKKDNPSILRSAASALDEMFRGQKPEA